jgi:hypothetical protein
VGENALIFTVKKKENLAILGKGYLDQHFIV